MFRKLTNFRQWGIFSFIFKEKGELCLKLREERSFKNWGKLIEKAKKCERPLENKKYRRVVRKREIVRN